MTYDYKCPVEDKVYEILMNGDEFEEFKKQNYPCPICAKEGTFTQMVRLWNTKFVKIFLPGPGFTRSEV